MRAKLPERERKRLVELGEQCLWSPEGADVLRYLRKTRRLSDEQIRLMRAGYIPPTSHHPELAGRLIMPLYDPYEELVVITSRDIRPECPKDRKHWHESFDKKDHLYGLNVAKADIIKHNKVIVVEGQFDVGYLRSIGIGFVVAVCGTALGLKQASILARYCEEVYLMFDGDKGGREACIHSMKMYEDHKVASDIFNCFVYPVDTPLGKDPDNLTKQEVIALCKDARHTLPTWLTAVTSHQKYQTSLVS